MMNIRLIVCKILLIIEKTERISRIKTINLRIEMIVLKLTLFLLEINHYMNFLIRIDCRNKCRSFSMKNTLFLTFEMRIKNYKNFSMMRKKVIVWENFLLLITREMIQSMIVEMIFLLLTEVIFLQLIILVMIVEMILKIEILIIFFVIQILMTFVMNNLSNFDQNSFLVNVE